MPRTEVYQLRLTPQEKDKLARIAEAKSISIARMIREQYNLHRTEDAVERDCSLGEQVRRETTSAAVGFDKQFALLVAKHKLRMSTPAAERRARKELEP